MKVLFLGTGTSTGVPTLCCTCEVCRSSDPRNHRLRASVMVENGDHRYLVDTSTDLRQQCLKYGITRIDGVLYTHHHADHVHGIDELRCFNFFNKVDTPCYGNAETLETIQKNFSYIFNGRKPEGGGIPRLVLHTVDGIPLHLGGMRVTPVEVDHGSMTILGYRFNDVAYVTDASGIPEPSRRKLEGLELLILNALGFKPHPTHFCLSQSLDMIERLKPRRAILTHINHSFDHETVSRDLPGNVSLAYDGLTLEI